MWFFWRAVFHRLSNEYKYCSGVESTSKSYYDRSYKSESNVVVRKLGECEGGTARSIHCESISEVAEPFIIKQLHAFSPPSGVGYDHELHTPFFSAKSFNDPIFSPQLHCGFFSRDSWSPTIGEADCSRAGVKFIEPPSESTLSKDFGIFCIDPEIRCFVMRSR